jgi:hypothetical protein
MARSLRILAIFPVAAAAASAVLACSRSASEPPPTIHEVPEASPDDVDFMHAKDKKAVDAAAVTQRIPPPPLTDAGPGNRQPDWDLDPKDPARDYVEQYVQSTQRYGDATPCVHAQPSRLEGGRTVVDTRATGSLVPGIDCAKSSAVKDTFAVQVSHDRLALADPAKGNALAPWPDGSDPGGPPAPGPTDTALIRDWQSPIKEALKNLQLVPVRVQSYGRGSYLVVTIAGWHGAVAPDAGASDLKDAASKLCAATKGRPLGIFAGLDRRRVLHVRCPDETRFEGM